MRGGWQLDTLKYTLGLSTIMSFYGIVTFIVYMLPPGNVSTNTKIVTIALVLLTLPFVLIGGYIASRRSRKKAEAEAAAAEAAKNPDAAAVAEKSNKQAVQEAPEGLVAGMEEAVQFLKTSELGAGGRDAVYSLPWYVVAGLPKSGKSSLAMSSGLNYQTLPSQRQSEQKFVRPTGEIDWRVTNEAVFIDTAGRFQNEGAEAGDWNVLLDQIKKYRPNRPIDGYIIAVDAARVQNADERELEEYAKNLRTKLDEAIIKLKVRFPVYLVFTHADSIEGFSDSFSTSKNEGKNLVWGSTFPIEKAENAQSLFDGEYELLHDSLLKRRLIRLSAPFPAVRQLRIFNFPLHFGSVRRRFGSFVNALFRPNPFNANPFLRGFYFTASPSVKAGASGLTTLGNTYFAERLVKDVILRDRDLVRAFQAEGERGPIWGWILTAIMALAVMFCLVMAAVSLFSNKQMLDEAAASGDRVLSIRKADAGKNLLEKPEREVRDEILATENLRGLLVNLDEYERDGAPLELGFGLYSGNSIYKEKLLPNYYGILEQRFKVPTVKKIEDDLRKFAASNPAVNSSRLTDEEEKNLGKHYDLLKAYLMLSEDYKQHAEGGHIATVLKDDWVTVSKIPEDMKPAAIQQLEFWAKQVDRNEGEARFPRINLDLKLVEETRRKLQLFPAISRYYKRKVTEVSKEVDDKLGLTSAEVILARKGGNTSIIEGTVTVPGAFTRPGYDLMQTAISEATEKLSEEDWVMGELGKREVAQTTDASMLNERYLRDYSDNWKAFVKGLKVKPYENKDQASQALQDFSSALSPMTLLLEEVSKNTNLSADDNSGWWAYIKSFIWRKKAADAGNTPVEKEFRPLFTFIGQKDQKDAPMASYQAEIGRIYNRFNPLSVDQVKELAQNLPKDPDYKIRLASSETAITNMTGLFNETSAGQEIALLLKRPVENLKTLLGADAKTQLAKMWTEQILPTAREVEKGYPFDDGTTESDLRNLTAFLNPADGKLTVFYNEHLEKFFEGKDDQIKLKEPNTLNFSPEFVTYLKNAFTLRKALFGNNPTPKFEYEFSLKSDKGSLVQIAIDGQKVDSEGTGSINGSFPASGSAETGVIITTSSTTDATTTTTPAGDANSAAPAAAPTSGDPKKFSGNWGLFRFVDAGGPQKQAGGEYNLSYRVGGKTIAATIRPRSGDLFDKTLFRQVKSPDNMFAQ